MNANIIELHIERLILDGIPLRPGQSTLVQAAVEAELARLLAAEGLAASLQSGGALPSVPGGAIQLAAESSPIHLGRQIAQSVYSGIGTAK